MQGERRSTESHSACACKRASHARDLPRESIMDQRPSQIEAAAELEESVRVLLGPVGMRQVLLVLRVAVGEHLDRLVQACKGIRDALVIVLHPVVELEPIVSRRVCEGLPFPTATETYIGDQKNVLLDSFTQ
eukprot:5888537-Pleurochrysis_carterae.AAC.2